MHKNRKCHFKNKLTKDYTCPEPCLEGSGYCIFRKPHKTEEEAKKPRIKKKAVVARAVSGKVSLQLLLLTSALCISIVSLLISLANYRIYRRNVAILDFETDSLTMLIGAEDAGPRQVDFVLTSILAKNIGGASGVITDLDLSAILSNDEIPGYNTSHLGDGQGKMRDLTPPISILPNSADRLIVFWAVHPTRRGKPYTNWSDLPSDANWRLTVRDMEGKSWEFSFGPQDVIKMRLEDFLQLLG